jgi:DegV family protein with EDD domain
MSRISIVTDSAASIPEQLIQSLNIHWVPYYIHRGQDVLRDLVTARHDAFYKWLPTATELPKTASPGPGDYFEMYKSLADAGTTDIISIHMTSKGSGAYQAALVGKSMIEEINPGIRVEVIDTLNVSMCQGWMAIEAARAALAGSPLAEIVTRVRAMLPITRMIQTADTLRYLYLGGRIGRAKHLIGTLLNIKPLIGMQDGVIVPLGQTRSRTQAYDAIVEMMVQQVGANACIKIAYMHAAAEDEALKIKKMVEAKFICIESLVAELSPALGVHTGPGTAGVCYFPVKD